MWIDMNEPSVFSGPEGTIPKSALHAIYTEGDRKYLRVNHGEVHNAYGLMMAKATFEGIINR
jgi:alpha-glucosidase